MAAGRLASGSRHPGLLSGRRLDAQEADLPTDITATLANATSAVTLAAGDYTISTSVVVVVDLTFQSGAVVSVPAGVVLTLRRSLDAPLSQIFAGAGTVDLNDSRIPTAYPEWWGARIDDGSFDNVPALTAAVDAHPDVRLLAADYFTASTWRITKGHRTVRGSGPRWSPATQGTRIVVRSATAAVMQVGPDVQPAGGLNAFLTGVEVSRLSLWRDAAPLNPPAGQEAVGPTGLRAQYLIHCRFEELHAPEHVTGFYIGGCVATFFRRCIAFRSISGTGGGSSVWFGFYLAGRLAIGAAGGNASVYLTDCSASIGGSPGIADASGLSLDGGFADTFVTRFETTSVARGIVAAGVAADPDAGVRKAGNIDLHIVMPIIDQCSDRGIDLGALSAYAAVEIVDPYIALAPGALAAVHVHNGGGNVTLTGGQFVGFVDADAGGNGLGLLAENQNGVRATGTKIIGCRRPVGLTGCTGFDVAVDVSNPDQVASEGAIYLADCDRGRIASSVRGRAGAFPQGVILAGSGNAHISVETTGIDPACIAGGVANKLRINGASVTSAGVTGTHYVSGVTC